MIREIAFNELREEWHEQVKSDIKDEFILRKIDAVIGEDERLRNVEHLNRQIMLLNRRLVTMQTNNLNLKHKTDQLEQIINYYKKKYG